MSEYDAPPSAASPRRGAARRAAICAAVLELAAAGGSRAVSHPAIDRRLELARGSTSYYYRTRRELLDAAITHLTSASRDDFQAALDREQSFTIEDAADFIAIHLDQLLVRRRRDVLARCALAIDSTLSDDLRAALAGCLFSVHAAESLMITLGAPHPRRAAHDLISLLEGLLFDRTHGPRSRIGLEPGSAAGRADLRAPIHQWLTALTTSPGVGSRP